MPLSEKTYRLLLSALGSPEARDELVSDIENIQSSEIADGAVTDAKVATGIDAAKIGSGAVSNTEFGYLDGVTSAIQTQISAKLATASFTDAAVTSKVLTGYVSGAGTVSSTDTVLQAINKINGNVVATTSVASAALPSASFTDAAVTAKVLTGLGAGSATTILSTDTILEALAKLQAQISAL